VRSCTALFLSFFAISRLVVWRKVPSVEVVDFEFAASRFFPSAKNRRPRLSFGSRRPNACPVSTAVQGHMKVSNDTLLFSLRREG